MPGEFSHKRHLLFDLDGTLVDSSPAHAEAFVAALRPAHPELARRFDYPAHQGRPTSEVFASLGLTDAAEVAALTGRKQAFYRAAVAGGRVGLFPGVRSLLQDLLAAGRRLHVVTGASRGSTDAILECTGLRPLLTGIITAEDTGPGKPAPDPFLHVLRLHRLPPEACLVIEDAGNGVESARRAGLDVVLVNTGLQIPGVQNCGPIATLRSVLLR